MTSNASIGMNHSIEAEVIGVQLAAAWIQVDTIITASVKIWESLQSEWQDQAYQWMMFDEMVDHSLF